VKDRNDGIIEILHEFSPSKWWFRSGNDGPSRL